MKINYKNTALGLIDNPKHFTFGFPDPHITPCLSSTELLKFGRSLIDNSEILKGLCGNNIQYVSHTFMDSFKKAKHKLSGVFDEEDLDEGGIIISGGLTDGYTHWHTYYYYINSGKNEEGDWDYSMLFMDFSKPAINDSPNLDIYIQKTTDSLEKIIWNGYANHGLDETHWAAFIIAFVLFKKYCDLETKVVTGKSRAKHLGTKYVNETDKRITILDSTWFTTIVRSEGFMVGDETGGFFRLQPFGPNNSQRKLIWISPFEKQGYTREAKILNQHNNE